MIVKQVASKGKGSFTGLASYLLDVKNQGEKVEAYDVSNCPFESVEENVAYIKQMQELNQMVQSDKTLHLVVSFQEEEYPSKEVLADIEKELLKSLGMEEHHRLVVSHHNTNNFHFHMAVNRLNPENNLLVDPWKSKMKLQKKAKELEEKHGLQRDNHPVELISDNEESSTIDMASKPKDKHQDQIIHSGMKNLLTWIQEEALEGCLEVLSNPKSEWEDLHKLLGAYNLEIKVRANGLVIGDKKRNLFVKASSVHRELSKVRLEQRLGVFKESRVKVEAVKEFGTVKSSLWENYQKIIQERKVTKAEQLALEKKERSALRAGVELKYANQLRELRGNRSLSKAAKQERRTTLYVKRKDELKSLSEAFALKRKSIHQEQRLFSYKEYLLERALGGDEQALEALRNTKMMFKPNENILRHPKGKINHQLFESLKLQITKQGRAVYTVEQNSKIVDTGAYLKVAVEESDRAVLTSLQIAMEKYGKDLEVQGSGEFKKRVMMVNERYNLNLRFSNEDMKRVQNQKVQEKGTNKGKRR